MIQKEPVHGIPEVAKYDQPNGDVGGDQIGRVIGKRREQKCGNDAKVVYEVNSLKRVCTRRVLLDAEVNPVWCHHIM